MEIVAELDANGNEVRWEGIIVSRFEAMQRHRRNEHLIQTNHLPERRFVFSLAGGEHVVMTDDEGNEQLFRVTAISRANNEFILHRDARPFTVRRKI